MRSNKVKLSHIGQMRSNRSNRSNEVKQSEIGQIRSTEGISVVGKNEKLENFRKS